MDLLAVDPASTRTRPEPGGARHPGEIRAVALRSVFTVTPAHQADQADIREVARRTFPRMSAFRHMLEVFANVQIERRFLAMPLDWYEQEHTWAEKNAVYVREALQLSEQAARGALDRAGVGAQAVDAVVFVSSTGVSTPGLESYLITRLGLSPRAVRLPLWGLGCAGGAAGLARAADLVRAGYQNVLLIAVELCSLTFVRGDESKSNFVGTSLFADGAAALVLGPQDSASGDRARAFVHGAYSTLIDDSADVMGWDVVDAGLQVRFSRDIPALVRSMMASNVQEALNWHGWTRDQLEFFVVHPGGVKVLAAYEDALALPTGTLDVSRAVLRDYGNMSAPTVLFVLERLLRRAPRGRGLLSAMGPGFSAEHVLLEF